MANAARDENSRPAIICASKNDGITIVPIYADPTSRRVAVDDAMGGSDNGNNDNNAILDENSVPVWTALSSDGSGNIVEVYGDPVTNKILTDSQ